MYMSELNVKHFISHLYHCFFSKRSESKVNLVCALFLCFVLRPFKIIFHEF